MMDLFITFTLIGILVGVGTASYRYTIKLINFIERCGRSIWTKKSYIYKIPRTYFYFKFRLPKLKRQTREDNDAALAERLQHTDRGRSRDI